MTEHFAAPTRRSPVRSQLHRPISTRRSVSSRKCRRNSRLERLRNERKRWVGFSATSDTHDTMLHACHHVTLSTLTHVFVTRVKYLRSSVF